MGESSDCFGALRQVGKERRASNRESSAEILRQRGVRFVPKNDGAHLIVFHNGRMADFWPGTGKYRVRGKDVYRRGVFNLLRDLGVAEPTE